MQTEIFTLCDHAQDLAGKLVVVGTFDTIYASSFPVVHPSCSIAIRIRFNKEEVGKHKLKVALLDSNKKEIMPPIDGEMKIDIQPNKDYAYLNAAIGLASIKFEKAGKYSVELKIDNDKWKANLPLTLVKQ